MKTLAFVLLVPFATAGFDCATSYASTSTKASTRTVTTTITTNITTVVTRPTYTLDTATFVSIVGAKTMTIPLGPDFTPIVSARRSTTVDPLFYTQGVLCTTTVTVYAGKLKTTTFTRGSYIFPQKTITSRVATSTAYAACAQGGRDVDDANVIHRYRGKNITYWFPGEFGGYISPPYPESRAIELNARTCCEWVQRNNYTGFTFYPFSEANPQRYCQAADKEWSFGTYKGYEDYPGQKIGNGPGKVGGVYVEFVP